MIDRLELQENEIHVHQIIKQGLHLFGSLVEVNENIRFILVLGKLFDESGLAHTTRPFHQDGRLAILRPLPFQKTIVKLSFEYPFHLI